MSTDRRVAPREGSSEGVSRDSRSSADTDTVGAPREPAAVPASGAAAAAAPAPSIARGPALLALDGSEPSAAAARVALDLAERRGVRVHVLSVVDTRPTPIPPPLDLAFSLAASAYGEELHDEQQRRVREALSAVLHRPIDWPARVTLGTPSHAIVEESRRLGAGLVVLGLRRHHLLERALNDETTLNVMRAAPCPVLGVTPATTALPRRVLVGVDFSRASLAAARAARALMADEGTLVLAYAPPPPQYLPDDGERVIHELGVAAAVSWFTREVEVGAGAKVEQVVLQHDPGRSVAELLLGYAEGAGIDLIALGSHRHGRVERWILGSTTADVARDGSYSLLAVPPHDPAAP